MKEKAAMISTVVYPCPKCSKNSLVKIGSDLYQCADFKPPQENTSSNNDNFAVFVLGAVGWFLLLFLL